ncbi:MAG: hypothetical protein IKK59_05720 [Lachnospiraceae bacterium]|nr:hypothetical protein [Lachnospiraceae bacterium]
MKNLIIAALAAMEIMNRWYIYCRSQEDIILCTFAVFYFVLLLLWRVDKYAERQRRMRETSRRIDLMISQPMGHYRKHCSVPGREQVVCK